MNKKYLKYIGINIIILAIIVGAFEVKIRINQFQDEKILAKETAYLSLATKEERVQERERLIGLLNELVYIGEESKARLLNQISLIYFQDYEYNIGLEYAVQSLKVSEHNKDKFRIAKSLIDIANVCAELGGTEFAENLIVQALEMPITDPIKDARVKEYGYINLADIYSKVNRSDEAIECINKSYEFVNRNDNEYEMKMLIRKIVTSRALFYQEKVEETKRILDEIQLDIEKNTDISNLLIPYLGMRIKVDLYEGYLDEALDMGYRLFEICEQEGATDIQINHMTHIIEQIHSLYVEEDQEETKEILDNLEKILLRKYDELIKSKNEKTVKFILSRYEDNFRYLEYADRLRTNMFKNIIIGIVAVVATGIIGVILKRLARQNARDSLTQIYNRGKFDETYKKMLDKKGLIGILVIDIDYFKMINDNYGHAYGDHVLKTVAQLLEKNLIPGTQVFRYGGEEFCILSRNVDHNKIIQLGHELREKVEALRWDQSLNVTISIGISFNDKAQNLFKSADEKMYQSKQKGRNRVTY
ncbi:GGDEF domain-containing protein [Niameybacter massiliensis]|uniref:GGDEF domain-containing protein n=1 Tax=Holtiella tumoricola TaxID=3018743 RepID=A0AA42J035_9FIRM|nr:GGDEF domain-containing protein [Holtiella tumoricola]MDA3730909.1 GGDEF domain-containing protein [Holtiella tumoricola]